MRSRHISGGNNNNCKHSFFCEYYPCCLFTGSELWKNIVLPNYLEFPQCWVFPLFIFTKFDNETLGSWETKHFLHAGNLSCWVHCYEKLLRSYELSKDTLRFLLSFRSHIPQVMLLSLSLFSGRYQLPWKLNGRKAVVPEWRCWQGDENKANCRFPGEMWLWGMKICEDEKLQFSGRQMRVQRETFGLVTWTATLFKHRTWFLLMF